MCACMQSHRGGEPRVWGQLLTCLLPCLPTCLPCRPVQAGPDAGVADRGECLAVRPVPGEQPGPSGTAGLRKRSWCIVVWPSQAALGHCTLQSDHNPGPSSPGLQVNSMRNRALANARTDAVLLLDVDFWPSAGAPHGASSSWCCWCCRCSRAGWVRRTLVVGFLATQPNLPGVPDLCLT